MIQSTDQLNRFIHLSSVPKRIVSLVPSQTELLFDLGLEEEVVGITKFCVHPGNWFRNKTRVGGTKNVNMDRLRSLTPDLVIANKEENTKEQIEEIEKIAPVWISDINDYNDALEMILKVGILTNKKVNAEKIIEDIENAFSQLRTGHLTYRSVYFIWKDPYMIAGGNTFISDMMHKSGFENVAAGMERYPQLTIQQLAALQCEVILLSSEPYPFNQKHLEEIRIKLPSVKVVLVDGEMFSWYGSRMRYAPAYFQKLLTKPASGETGL